MADDKEDQHGIAGRLRVHVDAEFLVAELQHERMVVNDTCWQKVERPRRVTNLLMKTTPHCGRTDVDLQQWSMTHGSEKTAMATVRSRSNLTEPTKLVTAMLPVR